MEMFPENSRSQHVNIFKHSLVLSMQKTGPVQPFYMVVVPMYHMGSAAALSSQHGDAKEKHTDIHLLPSSLPLCSTDSGIHSHYF